MQESIVSRRRHAAYPSCCCSRRNIRVDARRRVACSVPCAEAFAMVGVAAGSMPSPPASRTAYSRRTLRSRSAAAANSLRPLFWVVCGLLVGTSPGCEAVAAAAATATLGLVAIMAHGGGGRGVAAADAPAAFIVSPGAVGVTSDRRRRKQQLKMRFREYHHHSSAVAADAKKRRDYQRYGYGRRSLHRYSAHGPVEDVGRTISRRARPVNLRRATATTTTTAREISAPTNATSTIPSPAAKISEPHSIMPTTAATAATSRLGFLKQTSTATLLMAATCGLLLPLPGQDRAVSAKTMGEAATSATTPKPGDEMVWQDADSGTVVSTLSQVEETYCEGFVAYLARFLLNYDDACKAYFRHKMDIAVKRADGSERWEEFRGFVASVSFGLNRFGGPGGPQELCESLYRKYASRNPSDGSREQLATLFSLLPPDRQPVAGISSLLAASSASPGERTASPARAGPAATSASAMVSRVSASMSAVGYDLPSILEEDPSCLLPTELVPQFDKVSNSYYVPGVRGKQGEMLLVFGTRGPFPISKERALTAADYALFAACGAFGCTTTHMGVVPLDVVKTRLQTEPGKYEGLAQGVTTIAKDEGWRMLMQGMGPTLVGYMWYGVTVYPGYELFKRLYIGLAGPLNAALFRVPLVLAAGATATVFACIGVCPAEAVRIRQVADPTVGNLPNAVKQIVRESGWGKLFEGLPSILFRQISFGMMKFLVFDFFTEFAYAVLPVLAEQTSTQLSVSLTSGLVAGVCAAIVSQPADTVLSVMNRDPGRASILGTLRNIIEEQGIGGLFLGLQSRIVWSGAIISGQFLLYDVCKTALHVSADDLKVFLDVIASVEL